MFSSQQQSTQSPEQLRQAFDTACTVHSQGHLPEALQHYLLLLKHLPHFPLLHYNLGLVRYDLGDYAEALHAFATADTLAPADVDTLFNLALCHKQTGDAAAAIATYRRLLALEPDHADCLYNLGGCYLGRHEDQEAMACYRQVLALRPDYLSAVNNLAYLHHRAGETEQAIARYGQVLEQRPEDESVRYLLAALLGIPLDQAPDAYVRNFFDTYAEGFEQHLVDGLGYDNPRQLLACLGHSPAGGTRYAHGLDLGCGTGLSGQAFCDTVAELDGVDLSAKMLAQAVQKGCYARLHHDSILHHLADTEASYDFFLATDVFIYVGELEPIFTAARTTARPGALFCFSTERLDADGYRLLPTGRFAYAPAYIKDVADRTGWRVLTREAVPLRRHGDAWLAGDVWICRLVPGDENNGWQTDH
ncbi:MAG: tetratricopeptide repeat protein [Desulfobulbus sp.]|jgi:predicted TPR repeat methyltransferase|uniref:tetratricopeptide repeat protein n=1 Tax=Desulfobulbus sp. TaxID=895 RepID=UPI00283ECDC4|nr:tetratricopeptide repeat protein [Desulfobulbus sp.]MDR2551010.1 tetratricopeptide repeat protein [Desulfobulbus sp.]